MDSLSDQQLLRDYAEHRSEPAFAELVRRHVDLVYSAALRMVCDAHLAEDVAQGAFVALAQNARQLSDHPVLSGWLHRTAQNLAANIVRSAVRRRAREQEAAAMNELLSAESDVAWEKIAPHLDAALGDLTELDRDALLLRYFERKSAHEIAQAFGISDEAAQKRVSRAVERMREFFSKRGIAIGAGGLVVVVSANAVQAAPVALAATISSAAVLAGTTISASTAITATKIIAMTTFQKVLVTATVTALVAAGVYQARQTSQLREQVETFRRQQAPLNEQIQQLQRERDDATNRLAAMVGENALLKSGNGLNELLRLRSEVGTLRQQTAGDTNSANQVTANLMNSTPARELASVQIRQKLKSLYAPFVQSMNLSPEQTDQLYNFIVENELKKKEMLAKLLSGDMDVETALQTRDNAKTEMEKQIAGLLGDSGYAQLDQYNHKTSAAELVTGLNRELGNLSLNDEQSKQLQALFQAKPDIIIDDTDLFRSPESLNALFQTLVDRGHHDLQQAATFLSPEQLAAAYTIQSNYFNTIRSTMTLGQQLVAKKQRSKN